MKVTAQATMVMGTIFAIICFGVAIQGFSSFGEIVDETLLADAKGFAWFWAFLGSVAAAFALLGWWLAHTHVDGKDD